MKKRTIIPIIMLLAVSSLVAVSLISCKPANKNIGLQLYSIRDSITNDIPGAIARVAKMGYTFVEPAGYGDGKFYGMTPSDFRALCEKNNLPIISSHTGQVLPDSANWEKTMAWWDECIAAHAALGVKFIVQPFMGEEAYRSLDTLKKYCDYFNLVGEKCNAAGIRFGYHNHDNEFKTKLEGETIYDFMLANTDPARVMFQIDLYWAVEGGVNPVDYFKKYPGRFELWHIKDKEEIGASGMMDFASIWAGAALSGMQYGIVEVERYNYDVFTSCQKSIEFLNAADYVVMPK
jgi:sugar phosphate isomerase/epimerase